MPYATEVANCCSRKIVHRKAGGFLPIQARRLKGIGLIPPLKQGVSARWVLPMTGICCECCLNVLSEAEERAFLAAYNATPESELCLLSVTCTRCREKDAAVQRRMHRVLSEHFKERGR